MAYLLASLNILVHCTVYGDGIHIHFSAPTQPGHLFPFASIYYLPSVIVNFSVCSVLLSVQLFPSPPLPFPQESHPSWI